MVDSGVEGIVNKVVLSYINEIKKKLKRGES